MGWASASSWHGSFRTKRNLRLLCAWYEPSCIPQCNKLTRVTSHPVYHSATNSRVLRAILYTTVQQTHTCYQPSCIPQCNKLARVTSHPVFHSATNSHTTSHPVYHSATNSHALRVILYTTVQQTRTRYEPTCIPQCNKLTRVTSHPVYHSATNSHLLQQYRSQVCTLESIFSWIWTWTQDFRKGDSDVKNSISKSPFTNYYVNNIKLTADRSSSQSNIDQKTHIHRVLTY